MLRAAFLACAVAALAACGGGTETVTVTTAVTESTTVSETVTVTETAVETSVLGVPEPVAETHAALLEAARSGDYEALRPLIPDEFSYTFGGPVEGGPIAYWQRVEAESDERPIEILARILELPHTLSAGTYVWPFAYDKQESELTAYERELLGDLAAFGEGSGYLGWRAGIAPDGTWRYFIAGD